MNNTSDISVVIRQMIKKLFIGLILTFWVNSSFSQNITTLVKLNNACVQLGSNRKLPQDSLQLQSVLSRVNMKIALHMDLLLKAAEFYLAGDYENSDYYIKQVHMNFRNIEYNNLKLLLMICNYAHLKDVPETARYYYIIEKINSMEPGNKEVIHKEIAGNLDRTVFDNALARYFYYHRRMKILDAIFPK